MKLHKTTEVIDALVGKIHPEGATHIDNERYQSLEDLISVIEEYISRIENIAEQRNDSRASVKAIAKLAYNFRIKLTAYED
jgi:hypothetical protein